MKKLLWILLLSLPAFAGPCPTSFSPLAYPVIGCTVSTNNWTWVYPDQTSAGVFNFKDIAVAGWHRDSFDPFTGRMFTYQEVPGETTFSYEGMSYGWQTTVAQNPWIHEFTNNDAVVGGFSSASYHATVTASGIAATDTTINATVASCTATTATFFNTGGKAGTNLYLKIDDEVMKYTGYTCSGTTITFTGVTRGLRGTTAVCHNPGGSVVNACATVGNGDIWQGAPNPQFWNRATGAFTAAAPDITATAEGQHPFHETAFDTTRERWIRLDGKPEVGSFQAYLDFYNFNSGCTNGSCVPANASTPSWFLNPLSGDHARFLQNVSGTKSDFTTDGALEYDGFHDGLMQIGGGSSASNVTSIMCFTTACESSVSGAPTTAGPNANGTYLWASPTVSCYAVGGVNWDGTACSGAATSPRKTIWQSMVWDSNIKRYVLFGGGTGSKNLLCLPTTVTNPMKWDSTNCPSEPNDVFIYNPEDASWRQVILNPNGDNPAPARRPAITYDSSRKVEVLWEGPITYDSNGNPWVGRYESGLYKLTISNVPANGTTGTCTSYTSPGACATGQWTIQGATGCQSSPCASGPPLPYSQESANSPTQGCSATNDLLITLGVPSAWQASHAYSLNQVVYSSKITNGQITAWLQEVTTAGTSGTTTPIWNTSSAGTTTDGTVVWTNKGVISFECDHSTENIVYDSVNDGYIYEDIDTSGTNTYNRVQVWQIPASAVTTSSSPNPPSAPTGLTATAGNAQVSLTWSAVSGATSYNVYDCTATCGSPLTNYSKIGSSTATHFTATGLTNTTLYTFVVTAVNSAGESGASNQMTATPAAAADVRPSPTSLSFTTQPLFTTSPAQTLTLNNPGGSAVTISSFAIAGDYSYVNVNCPQSPSTLGAGASCTVNITFCPTLVGTRNGTFTITDTGTSSPQVVPLTGTGGVLAPSLVRGSTIRR